MSYSVIYYWSYSRGHQINQGLQDCLSVLVQDIRDLSTQNRHSRRIFAFKIAQRFSIKLIFSVLSFTLRFFFLSFGYFSSISILSYFFYVPFVLHFFFSSLFFPFRSYLSYSLCLSFSFVFHHFFSFFSFLFFFPFFPFLFIQFPTFSHSFLRFPALFLVLSFPSLPSFTFSFLFMIFSALLCSAFFRTANLCATLLLPFLLLFIIILSQSNWGFVIYFILSWFFS